MAIRSLDSNINADVHYSQKQCTVLYPVRLKYSPDYPNFPCIHMVQSTLLRKPSLIAPPSSIWELPLQCGGGDPLHPPQIQCSLWQNRSALGCTEQGSITAVVCEGWGPATPTPHKPT